MPNVAIATSTEVVYQSMLFVPTAYSRGRRNNGIDYTNNEKKYKWRDARHELTTLSTLDGGASNVEGKERAMTAQPLIDMKAHGT